MSHGGDSMVVNVISKTEFKTLPLKGRGKVRDIYDLGSQLLIVATDRISAFDVVMPIPYPIKEGSHPPFEILVRSYQGYCSQSHHFDGSPRFPSCVPTL